MQNDIKMGVQIIAPGARETLDTVNELIGALRQANRLLAELAHREVVVDVRFSGAQGDQLPLEAE